MPASTQYELSCRAWSLLIISSAISTLVACSRPIDRVELEARAHSECLANQTRSKECDEDRVKALELAVLEARKEGISEERIQAAKEIGHRRVQEPAKSSPYQKLLSQWGELDQKELNARAKADASQYPGVEYSIQLQMARTRGENWDAALESSLNDACADVEVAKTYICQLLLNSPRGSTQRFDDLPREIEAIRNEYIERRKSSFR